MTSRRALRLAAIALSSSALLAACSSSGSHSASAAGASANGGSGTVNIGISTSLSGTAAALGADELNGIKYEVNQLNSHGGLLGKKLNLISLDDAEVTSQGVSNARALIDSDHVKALFGPVEAPIALAEQTLTASARIPFLYSEVATTNMTSTYFNPYSFRIRANAQSFATAIAAYIANHYKNKTFSVYTVSPNISYGTSLTAEFLSALKTDHVHYTLVGQQWPSYTETSFTSDMSAILSAHPSLLFLGIVGGSYVDFVKEAESFGLLPSTLSAALCNQATLLALGSAMPAGSICGDYAIPPELVHSSAMSTYEKAFQQEFGQKPVDEEALATSMTQAWAQAVQKAGTFTGSKVAKALEGLTVKSVDGTFTIRACDHQAEVPVAVGATSTTVDAAWGSRAFSNVSLIPASQTLASCSTVEAQFPAAYRPK